MMPAMTRIAANISAQDSRPVNIILHDDESPATAILRHWSSEPATTKNERLIVARSSTRETKADATTVPTRLKHRDSNRLGWPSTRRDAVPAARLNLEQRKTCPSARYRSSEVH